MTLEILVNIVVSNSLFPGGYTFIDLPHYVIIDKWKKWQVDLLSTKPFSKPVVNWCQLDPQ